MILIIKYFKFLFVDVYSTKYYLKITFLTYLQGIASLPTNITKIHKCLMINKLNLCESNIELYILYNINLIIRYFIKNLVNNIYMCLFAFVMCLLLFNIFFNIYISEFCIGNSVITYYDVLLNYIYILT